MNELDTEKESPSGRFRNYTEALRNIVLILAVIFGGLWTLTVFNVTLQRQNAVAELEKLKRELRVRPIIHASLSPSVIQTDSSGVRVIQVVVTLNNEGTLDTAVRIDANSLRVALVQFKDHRISSFDSRIYSGQYIIGEPSDDKMLKIGAVSLRASQSSTLEYLVTVDRDGLYAVNFAGYPETSDQDAMRKEADKPASERALVSARGFLLVQRQ
jgi:hypothetical protein